MRKAVAEETSERYTIPTNPSPRSRDLSFFLSVVYISPYYLLVPPEDLIDSRRLQYSGLLINDDTGFLQRGHVIRNGARRKSELIPEADFPALGPRINPVGTAYVRGRVIPITQGKLHDQLF